MTIRTANAPRARKRAGFALLAVIWGTGLIATMVVAFMTNGRLRLQTAQNIARATEAAFVAESAINLATVGLLAKRDTANAPGSEIVASGEPTYCVLDRAAVALAIEDEGGKIDINAAGPELLGAALAGLGLDPERARKVAAAIEEFRTPQDRPAIANAGEGGKPFKPKLTAFETTLELDQVNGIDPELFRALLPFVTVYSKAPGVDARASPPALFAALAGFPVEQVRALIAAPYPNKLNRTDPRFPTNFNLGGDHGAYLVHAEVLLASGQTASRDAILDIRPTSSSSFTLREMRRGQSKYLEQLRAMISSNGAGVPDC